MYFACTYFVLLYLLFEGDGAFLVFAPFVLEPHAYDPRAESSHLDQLLLHEGVWSWVGRVARPQRVQLLLVEHRPDAGRFAVRRAFSRRTEPAVAGTVRTRSARTLVRTRFRRVCKNNIFVKIRFPFFNIFCIVKRGIYVYNIFKFLKSNRSK